MLDTLSYAESLISLGIPENQAKIQARALSKAFESNNFITKTDFMELKTEFMEMRTDLIEINTDIQQIKSDQRGIIIVTISILMLLAALIYLAFYH